MIIELFLNLLYKVFTLLTSPINIPSLPPEVYENLELYFFDSLDSGFRLLAYFFPMDVFAILFAVIIAIDIGISIYHFVLWIIRKIPMAGIT